MIIRIEDLKNVSQTILTAVDSNELSIITETLELKIENNILYMNVTNREYYAQVKLNMNNEEEFHATVNANLFLKLVSQITTDTVEFSISGNSLVIKANGTYKLPLIYDDDKLLELPIINIDNITSEFDIDGDMPNNSDVAMILGQYINCMEVIKKDNVHPYSGRWYWKTDKDAGSKEISTSAPAGLKE